MDDYTQRFGGISRLYGTAACQHLSQAHVMVAGIGGVGSWTAEALARTGLGKLTLIDLDELCVTNTNRQIHATSNSFGRSKVRVMAERIRSINPQIELVEIEAFFSERNAEELLAPGIDLVVDTIDVIRPKVQLLAGCHARGIPVITCGAAGGRRDPFQIQHTDLARTHRDALLLQVRKHLRTDFGFPAGGNKPKKFGIPALFSPEAPVFPQSDGEVSVTRPVGHPSGLRCDAGYGTATHLTGSFGFFAASMAIDLLLATATKA